VKLLRGLGELMMPIDLEKKNLEMHVELQALRDQTSNEAVAAIEKKIEELVLAHKELKQLVDDMKEDRNNQLIRWGTAIIVTLFSALGLLFLRILVPALLSKTPGQ
jgi:hypothetical protein